MLEKTEQVKDLYLAFHAKMVELESLIVTLDDLIIKELYTTEPMSLLDVALRKVSLFYGLLQNKRYEELKIRFPNILWASVFLTSFASTESVLDDLCTIVRRQKNIELSQSDLRDKGVTRSQSYLSKVAGLDLSGQSVQWESLKRSNAVRNCLTHCDGIIADSRDREFLKQVINEDHALSEIGGHLVISKEFTLNFIGVSKTLVSEITDVHL